MGGIGAGRPDYNERDIPVTSRDGLGRVREKWFKRGQDSIKRKNKSGCVCIFNDKEELESPCEFHREWVENKMSILDRNTLNLIREQCSKMTKNKSTPVNLKTLLLNVELSISQVLMYMVKEEILGVMKND